MSTFDESVSVNEPVRGPLVTASRLDAAVIGVQKAAAAAATRGTEHAVPSIIFDTRATLHAAPASAAKALLMAKDRKAAAQLESAMPELYSRYFESNLVEVPGGWRALRERLTALRAARCTVDAARLYFVLSVVCSQRIGTPSMSYSASAGNLDGTGAATLEQCVADLVVAEVAIAGRAEWPPRWAVDLATM